MEWSITICNYKMAYLNFVITNLRVVTGTLTKLQNKKSKHRYYEIELQKSKTEF